MWVGWRESVWSSGGGAGSVQGKPNCGGCWQGTRGAHVKHGLHGCDAGRIEAQRLVERRRRLPRRKGSIGRGATCGSGGERAWGGGGASSAQGGPNCGGCWQGTRGAHLEHGVHGCDSRGVEAQRLVERRCALPRRKGSIGRGATCGPGGGRACGGGGGASSALGWAQLRRLLTGHARSAQRTCSPCL